MFPYRSAARCPPRPLLRAGFGVAVAAPLAYRILQLASTGQLGAACTATDDVCRSARIDDLPAADVAVDTTD